MPRNPALLEGGRVLQIAILGSRGIPAKYGGFETFVEKLSEKLVELGVGVAVFCPSDQSYKNHLYKNVNLCFVPNLEKRLKAFGTLLYDALSLLKSSFSNFSIIYMLGYSSSFFCLFPKLFGKKVVINTDGLEWKRSKWNRIARIHLKLSEWFATKVADVLISDSLAIKEYYLKKYGINSVFITNGADNYFSSQPEILREFGLKKFDYYLVVARLEPENNIDMIINGFSSSKTRKKLFLITNLRKTKYYLKIKKLVKKDKRIKWFGPMYDRKKLNEIRANAFSYIHGHSIGGTNPSLLESMGCGSVVTAFDVPFNREVLRNNGFFFKDAISLKKNIENLEGINWKTLKNMRERNREIIKHHYDWNDITRDYFELFQGIVK
jgi:glycosyltransferase involved in cell wall biosynthesis